MLLLLASTAWGQQLKWEYGLFVGGATYQGDLVETYGPIPEETQPAYGGFARFNAGREWAFRLSLISGHISGSDQNFSDPGPVESRNVSFRSRLAETALTLEWEPFGNRRYPETGGYKNIFSPYVFGGAAFLFSQNGADYSRVPRTVKLEQVERDKAAFRESGYFALPFGGGIRIDLSKYTVLSLEGGLRKTFTDLLDGVSQAGNPETDDWYSFAGISLSRRFGQPDYDRDGIVDRDDACPREYGAASAQGCPDADGDGVEDLEDVCPLAFGSHELNGCPDADGDKVIDLHDACPETAGLEAFDGCPDTDEDGIIDREDACPLVAGVAEEGGCPYPDTDADGIIDKEDRCPNTPGVAEEEGCPYPDSDEDGVIDKEDQCPQLPGEAALGGCPDTDADGIIDPEDRCPNSPGPSASEGCPEIQEEEKAILRLAMESIRFETASAKLKPNSLQILKQIAGILEKYPDYHLNIAGHTDSRGNDETNLILSEKRAQSCFDYLTQVGINASRMQYQGYGETHPLEENATAEGRQVNRRVEFDLFVPEKAVEELASGEPPETSSSPETYGKEETKSRDMTSVAAPSSSSEELISLTRPPDRDSIRKLQTPKLPAGPDTLALQTGPLTEQNEPAKVPAPVFPTEINAPAREPSLDSIRTASVLADIPTPQQENSPIPADTSQVSVATTDSLQRADKTMPAEEAAPLAQREERKDTATSEKKPPGPTEVATEKTTEKTTDQTRDESTEPTVAPSLEPDNREVRPLAPPREKTPKQTVRRPVSASPRSQLPPDTIYWFEPQHQLPFYQKMESSDSITLPDIHLQPKAAPTPASSPSESKRPPNIESRPPPSEPPYPEESSGMDAPQPQPSLEEQMEQLRARVRLLEQQMQRLKQWIMEQHPEIWKLIPSSILQGSKKTDKNADQKEGQ